MPADRTSRVIVDATDVERAALTATDDAALARALGGAWTLMVDGMNGGSGASCALAAVIHACARTLGHPSRVIVGECAMSGAGSVSHAWGEVDGRLTDLSRPWAGCLTGLRPVALGVEAGEGGDGEIAYGIRALGLDDAAMAVLGMPFADYMSGYDDGGGHDLWDVALGLLSDVAPARDEMVRACEGTEFERA